MEYKDIKKLIDDMGESKIDELEIEFPEGVKISMKKNTKKEVVIERAEPPRTVIEASAPMTVPVVSQKQENSLVNVEKNVEENYKIIKSPMVGTFYASSSPDKDPYVKVGDKVKKGSSSMHCRSNEINE